MRFSSFACFRLVSLLAYGSSLLAVYYTQPLAAKAYNDLCAGQGMTFGEGESAKVLGVAMIVVAIPLLLARSNALIVVNLSVSLITVLGALALLSTVGNTPYECFTMGGTYEDHTSGLDEFGLWFTLALFLSYVFLLIDLAIGSRGREPRSWPDLDERAASKAPQAQLRLEIMFLLCSNARVLWRVSPWILRNSEKSFGSGIVCAGSMVR